MVGPGDTIDRYVIEGILGEGGMGRVYRAMDPRLGRRVAIKVLVTEGVSPEVRADAAARMLREARAVAAFSHPNVVAIHDVGEALGSPYITMELVSGSNLRAYVGSTAVSFAQKVEWLVCVARGLAAAHRAGLVHRDIKPENVMIASDGVVKILDFGIARQSEDGVVDTGAATAAPLASLTAEGMMIGTPQYMAPEQLHALPVDGRADQFAWGVMAWELFAGKLPWGVGKSGVQLITSVLASQVPPLVEIVADVPRPISDCVARAVAKERNDRFATMDELLVAFQAKPGPRPAALADLAFEKTALQPTPIPATRPLVPPDAAPSPARPPRNPWRRIAFVSVVVLAIVAPRLLGGRHVPAGTETTKGATGDAAWALVAPCERGTSSDCGPGTTPWCDPNDRVIACCGAGLAATGTDGVCDCPPGGVAPEAGPVPMCPKRAAAAGIPNAGNVIASLREAFRACLDKVHGTEPEAGGHLVANVTVSPDGRVFRARVRDGQMASRQVQQCNLDALRAARFDPPAGGSGSLLVPLTFEAPGSGSPIPTASSTPLGLPGRHPCRAKGSCAAGATAWCDGEEKELACCDPGLVAVGHDGMCECPPGGMTKPVGSCQPSKLTKAEWKAAMNALPDGISSGFHECLVATDAAHAWGSTELERVFDPDGRIATLRITHSSLPGVHAQQCILDTFRSFKAPPPPDGTFSDTAGIDLSKPTPP